MSAAALLAEVRAAGCTLIADGDQLKIRSETGPVPSQLVAKLRPHKAELRALLRSAPADVALDTQPVEARTDVIGWRLWSRALQRELWLARDLRAAEQLWSEADLPALLLDEWPLLEGQPLAVITAVLDSRSVFGPSVQIRDIRTKGAENQ